MRRIRKMCRLLAMPLAVLIAIQSMPVSVAWAGLVTSDEIIAREAGATDRARIRAFIDRADVRAQFESLGVSPNEAIARVGALSDEEVAKVAGMIDTMPAGQDAFVWFVAAVAILLLVLVMTDVRGITDVFPFIPSRPTR